MGQGEAKRCSGVAKSSFQPAWWLPGAHLQTIWPNFFRPRVRLATRCERLVLPDGDFIELHWAGRGAGPIVVVLHGLGGSIRSHYASGMLAALTGRGFRAVLMHLRGAGEEPNRLPRSYHSGDTADFRHCLQVLRERQPGVPLAAVGYSLGGNVLLKYLGEEGEEALLAAAVAVSVPFDLGATVDCLNRGLARIYQRRLLRCLKWSTRRKLGRLPLPVDGRGLAGIRTLREFDERLTAPLNGFRDAEDYYRRSSSRHFLKAIVVPTLVLHAEDDPFMPPGIVPSASALGPAVRLELSRHGGHAGFVAGPPWAPVYWAEGRARAFLTAHLGRGSGSSGEGVPRPGTNA